MSILNAENITHGFGGRQILEDASFRLLKGEHIGLIGANGEGKSTFLKTLNRMNDLVPGIKITGEVCYKNVNIFGQIPIRASTSSM